jgi:Ribonuclease HI
VLVVHVTIYTDGAARGNPGSSASGFVALSSGEIIKEAIRYNGIKTNNYAEYMAIILALRWCADNMADGTEVELFSDSELVVKQINGIYKVKSEQLAKMHAAVKDAVRKIGQVSFANIPRESRMIAKVDKELNIFLDSKMKH